MEHKTLYNTISWISLPFTTPAPFAISLSLSLSVAPSLSLSLSNWLFLSETLCPQINTPSNTYINSNERVYDVTITLSCNIGFVFPDGQIHHSITCMSNGHWDSGIPSCTRMSRWSKNNQYLIEFEIANHLNSVTVLLDVLWNGIRKNVHFYHLRVKNSRISPLWSENIMN